LPPDDSAYGFDNVGDVLGMSPVLLERFMEAAKQVGALAIGDPDIGTAAQTFQHPPGRVTGHACRRAADRHRRRHPREGDAAARRRIPDRREDVPHQPRRHARLEYEHDIEYTVDGARVHIFHMGGEADFKANLVNMTKAGDVIGRSAAASR